MTEFPALPGFYRLLFLYIEPASTVLPAVLTFGYPGALWFYNELVPLTTSSIQSFPDAHSHMAVLQLANCYLLLGLVSSFVFRAIRNCVPSDLVAQERLVGALLAPLAIADVTHIIATIFALPPSSRVDFWGWNATTHGNISFVVLLVATRVSWFLGIGRRRLDRVASDKPKTS